MEASDVRLADFTLNVEVPILIFYEYDFGDSWIHAIELTTKRSEAGAKYPRCIAGSRSAPPEDVGGPHGYAQFLQSWRDPRNEEHKVMRRWAGSKFDPEKFDLTAVNKAIASAMRRARGSYRFRHER